MTNSQVIVAQGKMSFVPQSGEKLKARYLEEPSVHLVPFESQIRRTDIQQIWGSEWYETNQKFSLRLYLPSLKIFKPPHRRLYLLFNGLAEADPIIYDDIGWELAMRKGIPAILIPLPMHFVRRHNFPRSPNDPYYPKNPFEMWFTTQRILNEIMCNPNRILHSYRQVMGDTTTLLNIIEQNLHPYWKYLFTPKIEVSLFGYSLGGFVALALLLLDPDRYKSIFLIESGVAMDQIEAGILFRRNEAIQKLLWKNYFEKKESLDKKRERLFSIHEAYKEEAFERAQKTNNPKECGFEGEPWRVFDRTTDASRRIWNDIVTSLYTATEKEGQFLTGVETEIFSRVVLGNESLIYKKQLMETAQKILIVAGGADEIFPGRLLINIGPDTGLPLLQIPGLTHWIKFKSREKWLKWKNVLIDLMETFNLSHPEGKELNSL